MREDQELLEFLEFRGVRASPDGFREVRDVGVGVISCLPKP
jgi:hypothetical protein